MSLSDKQMPVMVSGASGYLGSWLSRELLEHGFHVRGSVRSLKSSEKIAHLEALSAEFPGKLDLFEADLLREGSFDRAAQGCSVIYHSASPFIIGKIRDPQKTLLDPALKGTRNVLESANRAASVKRVVLTASVVSIMGDPIDVRHTEKGIFTEEHWNTTSHIGHLPYNFSKVAAEKEAWAMCRAQDRWDLITIHPGFVLGPSLSKRLDGASATYMRDLLNGKFRTGTADLYFNIVDVRDAARMHLLAGTTESASGRYICVAGTERSLDMARALESQFPGKFALPKWNAPKFLLYLLGPLNGLTIKQVNRSVGINNKFDHSKGIRELGMSYRPLSETYRDHATKLLGDGLLKIKS